MLTAPNPLAPTSITGTEAVISFNNVSARYWVPRENIRTIKEYAIRWLQKRIIYEELWALKDVSFEVYAGEIFGVIGRNGAGKSTLLKVVARVLRPTHGRVVLRGQVAPLLELGAGFHPELTGIENVYLNGALLGHSRAEIDALLPWIIEFSEMQHFMEAPLRTYSTGMQARLGFAVAVSKRPQILLVDEVLSVGDSRFQYKCLERMNEFRKQGTTILLVSHSMDTIQSFCNRALWLERGQVQALGPAAEVVQTYQNSMQENVHQNVGEALQTTPEQPSINIGISFRDVPPEHWVYPSLVALTQSGYEVTYEGGTFAPDGLTSRAQLAILALRCMWGPKYTPKDATGQIFPDVPAGEWLSCYIEENHHFGLSLSLPRQKYWPEMGVTRAQATYVLLKSATTPGNCPPPAIGKFQDLPPQYWAADWIEWACARGYIAPLDPNSNCFYPEAPISRAETIALMARILGLTPTLHELAS